MVKTVAFNVPEARVLGDLAGVRRDLEAVEKICARWLEEERRRDAEGEDSDCTLVEALCSAALVRYARTLGRTSVRAGIPQTLIDSLPADLQVDHQYFTAARNKWIAHSVNTFEENQVVLWLIPPPHEKRVLAVHVQHVWSVSLGRNGAEKLRRLAAAVRLKVEALEEAERQRLLALAQSLDLDQLYAQKDAKIPTVHQFRHPRHPRRTTRR